MWQIKRSRGAKFPEDILKRDSPLPSAQDVNDSDDSNSHSVASVEREKDDDRSPKPMEIDSTEGMD